MRKIYSLLFICFFGTSAWAQVVTPCLDSALPVEMASAIGWRFGSTVGVETSWVNKETNGEESGLKSSESSAMFSYQPTHVVGELYYKPIVRPHPFFDGSSDNTGSEGGLRIAIRGEKSYSVGIGYFVRQKGEPDHLFKNKYFEGSFSARLMESVYLAAGLQRNTDTFDEVHERRWNKILGGIAFLFGTPLETMFKIEGTLQVSPEVEFAGTSLYKQYKTTKIGGVMEVLFSDFLFSYASRSTLYEDVNQGGIGDLTEVKKSYGLGMRMGGLSVEMYHNTYTFEELDTLITEYQVTLGYNFI